MTSSAEMFLKHVANVVAERRAQYGDAATAMTAIADHWSVTLGCKITPAQVVLCLIDLKFVRLVRDPATKTPPSISAATPRCCTRWGHEVASERLWRAAPRSGTGQA